MKTNMAGATFSVGGIRFKNVKLTQIENQETATELQIFTRIWRSKFILELPNSEMGHSNQPRPRMTRTTPRRSAVSRNANVLDDLNARRNSEHLPLPCFDGAELKEFLGLLCRHFEALVLRSAVCSRNVCKAGGNALCLHRWCDQRCDADQIVKL